LLRVRKAIGSAFSEKMIVSIKLKIHRLHDHHSEEPGGDRELGTGPRWLSPASGMRVNLGAE
jgi:hypothetical protein